MKQYIVDVMIIVLGADMGTAGLLIKTNKTE